MQKLFLTLFYSGLSPKAPGTVGSLLALFIGLFLLEYIHVSTLFLLALLITAFSIKHIDLYEKQIGMHDSKEIVIDELVGMWITLSICGINDSNFLIMSVLAFLNFRLFDIWKPSLIGKIDKNVKGAWGVMGDDMLAGVCAGITSSGMYQVYLILMKNNFFL